MNHRFACLMAAGIGLAAGPNAVTSASPQGHSVADTPAQTVDIRYEFRPQLVRLGILPPAATADPLQRREHARGFEPGFSPEPPRQR